MAAVSIRRQRLWFTISEAQQPLRTIQEEPHPTYHGEQKRDDINRSICGIGEKRRLAL